MRILGRDQASVTIQLSEAELVMVSNALNEVCNGVHIDDFEFETRLGHDRATLQALLSQIKEAFHTRDR